MTRSADNPFGKKYKFYNALFVNGIGICKQNSKLGLIVQRLFL